MVSGGEAIHIASAHGRILLFRADDIPVVSGPAKGVIAIRMDSDDTCLGGILVTNSEDTLVVESAGAKHWTLKKAVVNPPPAGAGARCCQALGTGSGGSGADPAGGLGQP